MTRQGEKFTSNPSFHKSDFPYEALVELVHREFYTNNVIHEQSTPQSVNNDGACVTEENGTSQAWEHVYQRHSNKIFPIKNYVCKCFPELDGVDSSLEGNITCQNEQKQDEKPVCVMECGCGTGSCLFPLVLRNPKWNFIAFDFSSHAVAMLKQHSIYKQNSHRIDTFVWDVCDKNEAVLKDYALKADKLLLIFVLSALSSIEKMKTALTNIHALMKPGAVLLFRDYGQYDMAHTRFMRKAYKLDSPNVQKESNTFFKREDGTFSFFFSKEFCTALFTSCNFEVLELDYHCVLLRNKKTELDMHRVFINGRFGRK